MTEQLAFAVSATPVAGSALAVVVSRTLFHAVLWLALELTGTAGVFLLLDAEFLAAVQLLLYAGGIITIVVFAIVVTERLIGERLTQTNMRIGGGALLSAVLCGFILLVIAMHPLAATPPHMPGDPTRAIRH